MNGLTVQIDADTAVTAKFAGSVQKTGEAAIAKRYSDAYGKRPVLPDEFEVDEIQMIEVWDDL